jgi:esterase/lipase
MYKEPLMAKTNSEGKDPMENKWVTEDQFIQSEKSSDPRPVIMIHGFVGSPFDYKPLADALSDYDYDMIIPVVPGQVHTSPIMDRGDFTDEFYIDWLDSIITETTKRYGRKPYLIGFSMGGAMSSCVAEKDRIEKLVLLAPYYSLPVMNELISDTATGLKYILPAVPKFQKGKINDPEGYKRYKPSSDMISVKAFTELQKLAERGYEKA